MKLNGLLASPSFAAWGQGAPLDIQSMMYSPDGKPRCAIITTAHLSDTERQFVTSLVLSKLVTWIRAQSGTTDLRAMLYTDEVAGYLPRAVSTFRHVATPSQASANESSCCAAPARTRQRFLQLVGRCRICVGQ
jgi:hypothetical protein